MRPAAPLLFLVWLLCVSLNPAAARADAPAGDSAAEQPTVDPPAWYWLDTAFDLSVGYRTGQLNWSIAGNLQGTSPNVRSELSWSDLRIYQFQLANRTVIHDRVYLRGQVNYGVVDAGDNRDSDYDGDDRTLEFSRSLNGVDGNNVWDGSLGVGPRFAFFESAVVVCPLIGYAIAEQDLNIVDGYQAISPGVPPIGPIPGLDSRYEARWTGPWIGLDLLLTIPLNQGPFSHIEMVFTGEYHWADYSADADWNLRTDYQHPVSFTHDADGDGFVAGVTMVFAAHNRWGVNMGMNFTEMTTDPGVDRIFYADGTTATTRLNEVRWRSVVFAGGISFLF